MEKKGNEVIDLTPDGQKVDHYADESTSLMEERLKKEPHPDTSDRGEGKGRIPVEEPSHWDELKRLLARLFWKHRQ